MAMASYPFSFHKKRRLKREDVHSLTGFARAGKHHGTAAHVTAEFCL